ncbi:hypothetical protein ROJ8625_00007 [Roseivivax jejudonensis]|uniref:Hedgehog/Intein (Hint) domain-containing protein n=1 Tax=Roseivivax jejudonensis TaxID=1529041 RepID=A0A1X6Y304_9RHOB|nr:Hint domain-containing protein [Roseivivax jejudonensis]SLN09518.1 hypothetical protein ROJ8625_00007 [Roseivivax jejudonensis]
MTEFGSTQGARNETATGSVAGVCDTPAPSGRSVDPTADTAASRFVHSPCFTAGTWIKTDRGEVEVTEIRVGDRVLTRDHGYRPVRWAGHRHITADEMAEHAHLRPVRLARDALGPGLPSRDMDVSPMHCVLIRGPETQMLLGLDEVLVPARALLGQPGVTRRPARATTYVHFMFDDHELVMSDDLWTESFQPCAASLGALEAEQRDELLEIFPELVEETGREEYVAARPRLRPHEARLLLAA